jgi:8-oxo-dGTP pyrophosphatase MutT (NUDIX family)
MAFPGGHRDPLDADLQAAAMRETSEEIGLDLGPAEYFGALDQQRAMPRGRPLNMLIAPHVFALDGDPAFTMNHEVRDVLWADLESLVDGSCHDTETMPLQGKPTIFNGYRLAGGHFVWGLTYRMLKGFFSAVDNAWEAPREL